jgi:hypothetical protein
LASLTAAVTRRLPWWVNPMVVVGVLSAFGIYSLTVVLLFPGEYKDYLSPFYSPPVGKPGWLPDFITAPLFVLWIPLGFRATCYYYRKAYYRAFFWDPPACKAEAQDHDRPWAKSDDTYRGERNLFVWNNVHRYFLYASFVVIAFLWYDTVLTFLPGGSFGMKVGSLLYLVNVVLLTTYSLSCHSLRHIVGGKVDCYSCVRGGNARHKAYNWLSVLNKQHAMWAWLSLFSVLFADVYMRLIAAGVIPDLTIIG